jgi:hypothetical protein
MTRSGGGSEALLESVIVAIQSAASNLVRRHHGSQYSDEV